MYTNRRGYKGGAMRAEAPPPLGLRYLKYFKDYLNY